MAKARQNNVEGSAFQLNRFARRKPVKAMIGLRRTKGSVPSKESASTFEAFLVVFPNAILSVKLRILWSSNSRRGIKGSLF